MKKSVKQQVEPLTTLKVGKSTHKRIKEFCEVNNLWICRFVEEVINEYIDNEMKNNND